MSWWLNNHIFVLSVSIHATQAAYLRCYEGSITNMKELRLDQSPDFIGTFIKPGRELIIVVHGYSTEINMLIEDIVAIYMNTYGNTKSYCALNWKVEANAYIPASITAPLKEALGVQILGFDQPVVLLIALHVAQELGEALARMKSRGLNMEDVCFIGHSTGAHLSGNTGRNVRNRTGSSIGKIIGLDPGKSSVAPPLDKTCANFVYTIHTNPYDRGINMSDGDVDFWLNYGCKVQPGCKPNTKPLTNDSLCSHRRALLIIVDAVKFPNSLQGRRALNYEHWTQSKGIPSPDDINFIGPNINPRNKGSYYLCTNAESEFGKGPQGMDPATCTCPCNSLS